MKAIYRFKSMWIKISIAFVTEREQLGQEGRWIRGEKLKLEVSSKVFKEIQ